MKETWIWPHESADESFRMDKEHFAVRVPRFIADPVKVLRELREEAISLAEEDESFGNDVVGYTLGQVTEYIEFIDEQAVGQPIEIENPLLRQYYESGMYTTKGDTALFTMLKAAGFYAVEIQSWIDYTLPSAPLPYRAMVEVSKETLKKVYGEE